MDKVIFETSLYGIILTILSYQVGLLIYRKTRIILLHPLLISLAIIVTVILLLSNSLNISLDQALNDYNRGALFISFFLGPITVMLALPMYRQFKIIKKYFIPLILGTITSVVINFFLSLLFIRLFTLNYGISVSLLSKNITTPMALSLTEILNGDINITTIFVLIAGISGALISPYIFKFFATIQSPIAKGIAIGSNSHAVGTSKAFELGEIEGALSSTAIGLTGIVSVILIPILIRFFF